MPGGLSTHEINWLRTEALRNTFLLFEWRGASKKVDNKSHLRFMRNIKSQIIADKFNMLPPFGSPEVTSSHGAIKDAERFITHRDKKKWFQANYKSSFMDWNGFSFRLRSRCFRNYQNWKCANHSQIAFSCACLWLSNIFNRDSDCFDRKAFVWCKSRHKCELTLALAARYRLTSRQEGNDTWIKTLNVWLETSYRRGMWTPTKISLKLFMAFFMNPKSEAQSENYREERKSFPESKARMLRLLNRK